jgi:hypothetical protein
MGRGDTTTYNTLRPGSGTFQITSSSCAPAVKQWRLGADAVVDGQRLGDHGGRVAGAGWQQHGVARLGDVAEGRQVLWQTVRAQQSALLVMSQPSSSMGKLENKCWDTGEVACIHSITSYQRCHVCTCSAMRMEAAALPPFAVMAAEIWPRPLAVASALRKIASASPDVQQAALLKNTGVPLDTEQTSPMQHLLCDIRKVLCMSSCVDAAEQYKDGHAAAL